MISFILPAHNEQALLPLALQSIFSAAATLNQPFEVIVVDDASTDATANVARSAGAKVIPVNHRQIAATRNAGAKAAAGDILIFVDADTQVTAPVVQGALAALDQGVIGGGAHVRFDQAPLWSRFAFRFFSLMYFTLFRLAAGCFIFVRRKEFEAIGGFDQQFYASEEVHLSRALKARGRFVILPQHVITSARKVRDFSLWHILKLFFRFLFGGFKILKTREGLDLWYNAPRK